MGIIVGLLVSRARRIFAEPDGLAAPLLLADNKTIPRWVEIGAYCDDLARHAVRRLAHRAHDGLAHHEAAAGRRVLRGDRRGAIAILLATHFGIPVSTTHTITGSIVGVGATNRLSAVRWGLAGRIVWAWILTIPASAIMAAISYRILAATREALAAGRLLARSA